MKQIFTILLVLITNIVLAQNIGELDKKNGFKSYKLGSKKVEIQKRIDLDCLTKENPSTFDKLKYAYGCKVLSNPDKKVFSRTVKEVNLKFNENSELENIRIDLMPMLTTNLEEMYTNFKELFGKYTDIDYTTSLTKGTFIEIENKSLTASEIEFNWKGEKVNLNIKSYYNSKGTWSTIINVTEYRTKLKNGF